MTLARALAVLAANGPAAPGSFLHALHERDRFDAAAFEALHAAMATVAQAPPGARGRSARRHAFRVYQSILLHLIWHLHPHDGYRIRRLPARTLQTCLDRLGWVFEPVINGQPGYGSPPKHAARRQ